MKPYGFAMSAYLLARPVLQPLMRGVLRKRLQQGKEDVARVKEKLGEATLPRPAGPLIWLHAVGLGEVLALRPLIASLQRLRPDLHFLLTSSARSSAQVIGKNLPPNTLHQMLPLDGPAFMKRFLDHWRPDMSIWSEQDMWPGAIHDIAARGIPLAYVNARLNATSFKKRARLSGLYRDTYRQFSLITAQDGQSAAHLRSLGAHAVSEIPSLKPAAEPLHVDSAELTRLQELLAGRRVWVAASTHAADERALIPAQAMLHEKSSDYLLILTPRAPDRHAEIAQALRAAGLPFAQRSKKQDPAPNSAVLLADSFGELGLWFRLAKTAYIGASLGGMGGHNPWEAICLGLPVISGPDTSNFRADYALLQAEGLAHQIPAGAENITAIANEILREKSSEMQEKMRSLVANAREATDRLASDLLGLMEITQ